MKKLNKNSALLLSCVTLNNITSIFIYTYLLAFILDVSNNSIVNVAVFYLTLHISMIVLSWAAAPFFKRFNKALALKIGIMFKFAFVLVVVFFKDAIVNYILLIAICNAFSEVLFWGGANPLQPIVTKKNSLYTFMSLSKIFGTIISIIVPIFMGLLIDKIGIHIISITMIFVVVAQMILSTLINEKDIEINTKLNYKVFTNQLKESYPKAKSIYANLFLYGICSNVTMLILYYTVITFGSNLSLGIFSTIASIMSIIVLAIYNLKKQLFNNLPTAVVSSVAIIFSIVFIILNLNKSSLTTFYIFWNISIVVPEIITSSHRFNIVKNESLAKFNIENMTISETYLDSGRVVGEILLVLMGILNNKIFNIFVLSFITIVIVIYLIHTVLIEKKSTGN